MRILSYGEIIYDMLPSGACLGGAPLNVAVHLARMNVEAGLVSAIGPDELGRRAIKEIAQNNVRTELIQLVDAETGRADVSISEDGSANYVFNKPAAWDRIELFPIEYELTDPEWDGFVFGTLAQRSKVSRDTLHAILEEFSFKEILFDVNLRGDFHTKAIIKKGISCSTILKMNDDESKVVLNILGLESLDDILSKNRGLKGILLTKGSEGIDYIARNARYHQDVIPSNVVDTVGAGDSVSAAFLHSYIATDGDVPKALKKAAILSSFVVSTQGATSPYPDALAKEMRKK